MDSNAFDFTQIDLTQIIENQVQFNEHMVNIEYMCIFILVAVCLVFGGICALMLSRYLKG
jgi:hypothetical protein